MKISSGSSGSFVRQTVRAVHHSVYTPLFVEPRSARPSRNLAFNIMSRRHSTVCLSRILARVCRYFA